MTDRAVDEAPPLPGSLVNWLWLAGPARWERALTVRHARSPVEEALVHHFTIVENVDLLDVLSGRAQRSIAAGEYDLVLSFGALDDLTGLHQRETRPAVDALVRLGVHALRPGGCLALAHSNRRSGTSRAWPVHAWRAWRRASAVERRMESGGLRPVRRYLASRSLERFDTILPADHALIGEYLRWSSPPGLARRLKTAMGRVGLGALLLPIALHIGYR